MRTLAVIKALSKQQNFYEMSTEKEMQQAKEIYLNTLAADEAALKRQVRQQPDNAVLRKHMVWDNKSLIDLKQRKQKQIKEIEKQYFKDTRAKTEEAQRKEQEKVLLQRERNLLFAHEQQEQINEKRLLSRRAKMQEEKAEHNAERQKIEIHTRLQQIKSEQSVKLRKLQIPKDVVGDNLAEMKKKQEQSLFIREEQFLRSGVAAQEEKRVNRQKAEEEKKVAALKLISAHREQIIMEREQQKCAEVKSSQAWLQINKEADRLQIIEETFKKQKAREARVKVDKVNVQFAAEKQVRLHRLKQDEYEAAVRNSELIAETEKRHQEYTEREMLKLKSTSILPPVKTARREVPNCITACNGEALPKMSTAQTKLVKLCQERNKLQLSYREIEDVSLGSAPLPPIPPRTAKPSNSRIFRRALRVSSTLPHLPPI